MFAPQINVTIVAYQYRSTIQAVVLANIFVSSDFYCSSLVDTA